MKEKNYPFILAIAGVSGSGKTTTTKNLIRKLPNSKALYFDDYDFDGPKDLIHWVENGADYELWDLTPLLDDLKIISKQPVDYIILDFPFAYQHSQISHWIDLAVFIDTPLDIALARRTLRDFKDTNCENILSEMEHYIALGRKGYTEMLHTIKPDSDILIDGAQSSSNIVNSICDQLK